MKRKSRIDHIRESLRLQQIYNVFMRYGMDILLDRGVLGDFRRLMQEKIHDPPVPLVALSTPVRLRLMLEELGPIYVKMGQVISSRTEVLPPDWQAELNKLQSNVPPFPIKQARAIVKEELGGVPEQLFATFDPKPLAAASTAQIHRATLSNGQAVVVKVQRPDITTQAMADLGIMQNAARVFEGRTAWAKEVGLVSLLNEFGANVIAELDYGGEAYNAKRLSRNMESVPGVHIPVIYPEFSTSKVLTMEFIPGVKVTNLDAIEQAGLDRQELTRNILHALVKQLLVDGFFHGDPHPGNVLVNLETGVVTFLDTGMMGELDFNHRLNLINLLLVIGQHDVRGLAQVMLDLSTPFREVDEKAYYREFQRRLSRYLEPGSATTLSGSVSMAFDLLREHGLRLDPQLTLAIKALMQADAITSTLHPEASLVQVAREMVPDLLVNEITVENVTSVVTQQVTLTLREIIKRVPTLQEATIKWLEQYEKGRFTLHVDTTDLAKQVEATRGIANQVIVGIMLVGMIIGSSIAASVSTVSGDFWSFMPQLAFIGYTASMIIAGAAVLRLIWQLWRGQR